VATTVAAKAEQKTVESEVMETAAHQGEGVIGFVAAFTVPAIEILSVSASM
jgi:hypothetical protein